MTPSDGVWKLWFYGTQAQIWVHESLEKEFEKIREKDRAKLESTMENMYCAMEHPEDIGKKRYNPNEGRHGKDRILIGAFKADQGRIYGAQGSVGGQRAFFAASATVKKYRRAKTRLLKKAAVRLQTIDSIKGAQL